MQFNKVSAPRLNNSAESIDVVKLVKKKMIAYEDPQRQQGQDALYVKIMGLCLQLGYEEYTYANCTLKANPDNSVVGSKNNSGAIKGSSVNFLHPEPPGSTSPLFTCKRDLDTLLTHALHVGCWLFWRLHHGDELGLCEANMVKSTHCRSQVDAAEGKWPRQVNAFHGQVKAAEEILKISTLPDLSTFGCSIPPESIPT